MSEELIPLNTDQKKAVKFLGKPLLIIAGAGTGKTTVITERIKWILAQKKAKGPEILALTFTEKAAQEMQERVDIAMPYGYTKMWISTFHSFADRVLRDDAIHIGLNPGFRLMTGAESVKLLKDFIFSFNLSYFRPLGNPNKFITGMLTHFSRLKDEDISPNEYIAWITKQKKEMQKNSDDQKGEYEKNIELANAYKTYEDLKVKEGVADFSDLINNVLLLFRKRKNVLSKYRSQFKYILIDEFQDTNISQYELIRLLAPSNGNPNLTVVGDDNQSIYKFRGAAISNILSFKKDYKNAKTIVLNKNYRSTQQILDASYKLIKHNDPDTLEAKLGISKKLVSTRGKKGRQVQYIYTDRVENEADEIVNIIESLKKEEKYDWNDFAILVRANNHIDPFIRALIRKGIPYQFLGPGTLFKQNEIKDLISYLKVLKDPQNSTSLYRVLTMSIFNLSGKDIVLISSYCKRYNLSLYEGTLLLIDYWFNSRKLESYSKYIPFISQESKEKVQLVLDLINKHLELVSKESAGQILFYFLEDTGLLKTLVNVNSEKDEQRMYNITKFFDKLKTYEVDHEDATVFAVVDWIDLSMELGESPLSADTDWVNNNAVNLLTVHASKGLEFPVVFLVNLVSQRFPSTERREKIPLPENLIKEVLPEGDYHTQEERRLFYVGMTRACDLLYFSSANYYGEGKREKKISPFVYEVLGEKQFNVNCKEDPQLKLFSWEKKQEIIVPYSKTPVSFLSYSQIQTFGMCPLHYKLKYSLKVPTPSSFALSFGSTIHATLRDFYQASIAGMKVTDDFLFSLYDKNWISEGYYSKKHETITKERGNQYLKEYYSKEFNMKKLPVALETPFIFPVTNTLKFGGKIDRIDILSDGKIEIVDYKTSSKVPTQKDVDKDIQMTMYALAATEVKEKPLWKKPEDVVLSLYYFEEQKKISTIRNNKQLEEAKTKIIEIASKIENSDFKCSGTPFCTNCEYKMYCEVR